MSKEFLFTKEHLLWLLEKTSVDHDGVIADSKTPVTEAFNKDFGTHHTPSEIIHWNSVRDWGVEIGLSPEEATTVNDFYWHDAPTLFKAKPLPGAVEFMSVAYELGFRPPVNSSRLPKLRESTIEWYPANGMGFVKAENIHTCLVDIPDGYLSKVWIAKLLKRRLHIEDTPSHARWILDYTPARIFLLSDSPKLDAYGAGRLTRIAGKNGTVPDMTAVYELFFGKLH